MHKQGCIGHTDMRTVPVACWYVVQGGSSSKRSAAELSVFPYGSPKENEISSAVGNGTWSVVKQGGKVFLTVKVRGNCTDVLGPVLVVLRYMHGRSRCLSR
jgi:hypothetical protein